MDKYVYVIFFSILVALDLLLAFFAVYLIYKYWRAKKYEFFFVIIIIMMPIAFIINNIFDIYMIALHGKKPMMYDYHCFDVKEKALAFISWGPLVILLGLGVGYQGRWSSYYLIISRFMDGSYPKSKHKNISIVIFISLSLLSAIIFAIKLFVANRKSSNVFEVYLGIGFISISITLSITVCKFLRRLKRGFPAVYQKKNRIVKVFSISFVSGLFIRGVTILLLILIDEAHAHIHTVINWVMVGFRFNEMIPAVSIYYMLYKNLEEVDPKFIVPVESFKERCPSRSDSDKFTLDERGEGSNPIFMQLIDSNKQIEPDLDFNQWHSGTLERNIKYAELGDEENKTEASKNYTLDPEMSLLF